MFLSSHSTSHVTFKPALWGGRKLRLKLVTSKVAKQESGEASSKTQVWQVLKPWTWLSSPAQTDQDLGPGLPWGNADKIQSKHSRVNQSSFQAIQNDWGNRTHWKTCKTPW
jgi:hypothetical protein